MIGMPPLVTTYRHADTRVSPRDPRIPECQHMT